MSEPIEESYFNWLCSKVLDRSRLSNPAYRDLLYILHKSEFVWRVLGDKNRCEDGIELRHSFLLTTRVQSDSEWEATPCSIFEMLYAFALKAEFQTDMPAKQWFWIFITNLKLDGYQHISEDDVLDVVDILYNFVWRIYDPTGIGGIFPLFKPKYDQRYIEIWYQFCEYVEEQGLV